MLSKQFEIQYEFAIVYRCYFSHNWIKCCSYNKYELFSTKIQAAK